MGKFTLISKLEKTGTIEGLKREERTSQENEPYTVALLIISQEDIFTGEKVEYALNLGEIENRQMVRVDKIESILSSLKEQGLDVLTKLPDTSDVALHSIIQSIEGKPVTFWDVQANFGDEEDRQYITVKEPFEGEKRALYSNTRQGDLGRLHPELKNGDRVNVQLNAILQHEYRGYNKRTGEYFDNFDTRTDSREKLYQLLIEKLSSDTGKTAQGIIKRLQNVKQAYGDNMTYASIIQCVGGFKNTSSVIAKGDLNEDSITFLTSLGGQNRHIDWASLHYTFTFYNETQVVEKHNHLETPIFKTLPSSQPYNTYSMSNTVGALFCPHDCTIRDFSQLTNTLQSLKDLDITSLVKAIKDETDPKIILREITNALRKANYDLTIKIEDQDGVLSARAVGFAKHEDEVIQEPAQAPTQPTSFAPERPAPQPSIAEENDSASYPDELVDAETNVMDTLGIVDDIPDEDLPF